MIKKIIIYIGVSLAIAILGLSIGIGIGRATKKSKKIIHEEIVDYIDISDEFVFKGAQIPYDGVFHDLKVEGDLPEGVTVTYKNNHNIMVGTYEVTATFNDSTDKYKLPDQMKALMTIIPADFNVLYEDAEYEYTGSDVVHTMPTIPSRYTVLYVNNSKVEEGTYEAVAIVSDSLGEYSSFILKSNMTIKKTNGYGVKFESREITYDGLEHTISLSGNTSSYTVVYKNNKGTNAGEYKAEVTISDPNSSLAPLTLYATLTIKKASINATFEDKTFLYDDTSKSISVDGVPEGVNVEYSGNNKKEIGVYPVKATITDPNGNYEDMELNATLTITDQMSLKMDDLLALTDNLGHLPAVEGEIPTGVTVTYYNDKTGDELVPQTQEGVYSVRAEVVDTLGRYQSQTLKATMTIKKGYRIIFRDAGATIYSYYVEEGKAVEVYPNVPKKEGSTGEWIVELGDPNNVTKDLVFNVKYKVYEYKINYNTEYENPNVDKYIYSDLDLELLDLEVPGYVFIGWYLDPEFNEIITKIPAKTQGNIELYPCLKPASYSVKFYANDQLFKEIPVIYDNQVRIISCKIGNFDAIKWQNSDKNLMLDPNTVIDKYQYTETLRLDAILVDKNYGFNVKKNANNELVLTSYNGSGTSGDEQIIIPSYYFYETDYLPVVGIADECFKNYPLKNNIEKIVFPEGIRSIGESAFEGLSRLTVVELSKTVKEIKSRAFFGCAMLNSISLSNVVSIGSYAFSTCTALETVHLDNAKSLADYAFASAGVDEVYLSMEIEMVGYLSLDTTKTVSIYFDGTKDEFEQKGFTNLPEGYVLYVSNGESYTLAV